MPIVATDLVFRRSALVSDTTAAQNGGRMSSVAIVPNAKNNLFPDVSQSQRMAGAEHFRKLFLHLTNSDNRPLYNARLFLEDITPGDSYLLMYAVGHDDTEDDGLGRPYGVGRLVADLQQGDQVLSVEFEHAQFATYRPFRIGDSVRVANVPATGGMGEEAYGVVSDVTWSGKAASVTLHAPIGVAFNLDDAPVMVSSCITHAELKSSVTAPVINSVAGGYAGAIECPHKSATFQNWTITFTSSADFRLDGDTLGSGVATGSTSADFSPAGPSGAYFTLPAAGWSGTWAAGETLTFTTTPAAVPLFLQRVVPAGARSIANDGAAIGVNGESA